MAFQRDKGLEKVIHTVQFDTLNVNPSVRMTFLCSQTPTPDIVDEAQLKFSVEQYNTELV